LELAVRLAAPASPAAVALNYLLCSGAANGEERERQQRAADSEWPRIERLVFHTTAF
jgi:hypothetical protein